MKLSAKGITVTLFLVVGALLLIAGIVTTVSQPGEKNPAGILLILFGIALIYIGRRVRRIVADNGGKANARKEEENGSA